MGLTFVGVHVRRSDYHEYLGRCCQGQIVSTEFYKDAMSYFRYPNKLKDVRYGSYLASYLIFREKYGPKTVFVFASDDTEWIRKYFSHKKDVFLIDNFKSDVPKKFLDFATLSYCNHSIFRYVQSDMISLVFITSQMIFNSFQAEQTST